MALMTFKNIHDVAPACPKCGEWGRRRPTYVVCTNLLDVTCMECGYVESFQPLDARA